MGKIGEFLFGGRKKKKEERVSTIKTVKGAVDVVKTFQARVDRVEGFLTKEDGPLGLGIIPGLTKRRE